MSNQETCEIHGGALEFKIVPVVYGLPVEDDAFRELIQARMAFFPNARSHVLGGCTLGAIGPDVEALVCRECRTAEKEWAERNNRDTEPEIGGMFIVG